MVKSVMKYKIFASCDAGRLYSFKVLACMALSTDFGNSVYEQTSVYEHPKKVILNSLTTLTLSLTAF